MNKKIQNTYTIVSIISILLLFNLYQAKPLPKFKILKVENADEFYIDLNKNKKIDNNELIKLYDVNAFHNENTKNTYIQSQNLKLKNNEILALGTMAKDFAIKNFSNKNVTVEFFDIESTKNENYSYAKIYLNKTDIAKTLLQNGLATPNRKEKEYKKELNFIKLKENLKKIQKENIVILNEKTNTIHKLNCKHAQNIKQSKAFKLSNLHIDIQKCPHCFSDEPDIKTNITINQLEKIQEKQKEFKLKNFDFQTGALNFYFTDFNKRQKPDKNCETSSCKILLQQINNTQKSIDFAIYGIAQQPQIINALLKAKNRGVKIRWVTDSDIKGENIYKEISSVQKQLTNFKTDNHFYPNTNEKNPKYTNAIMHNKFFIFDDTSVWIGSSNLSQTDLADFNANINVLANSQLLANIYKQEFEQMYNQKFHELKTPIPNKENLKIDEKNTVSVYFSPTDKIITNKIIPAINNAQNYIYISSFIITHKQIENALIAAKTKGIDIKIITDATSANGKYSIHNILRSYNIPVKIENKAGKMHSKSIIIDDNFVFIGSMNLTKSGENKNDENVLLIDNSDVAKIFKEQFLYLYSSIPDIYLTKTPRAEGWDSIGSCDDGIDNDFDGDVDDDDNGCKAVLK